MSWSLFKTRCNVLTGNPHVTTELFAQTIATAYHDCMSMHFDTMTAAGILTNNAPKLPALQQQILFYCNANRQSTQDVDFLKQIGPAFVSYWTGGLTFVGPIGVSTVLNPGNWNSIKVPANTNFQIILNALIVSCRTHLMTMSGQYVSSAIPGVVSVWNGSLLQSLP